LRAQRVLPAASARTLYNVADALAPRGGDVDVAPWVEGRLAQRGPAAARRVRRLLRALEWRPVLTLRGPRGFSWLPREERRRLLERLEHSVLPGRRRAFAELRGWIEEALAEAARQSSGA
jgi:hypothetical protein